MNVQILRQELERVSGRHRKMLLWAGLAVCWLALALLGAAALAWARGAGYAVPGVFLLALLVLPIVLAPVFVAALRAARDPMRVARRIEKRFPDLDARLLAAVEQKPREGAKELGFLQQAVVGEALAHAKRNRWEQVVPAGRMRAAQVAQWALLAAFIGVGVALIMDMRRRPPQAGSWWTGGIARKPDATQIKVEPEDASIERGTSLLVLAKFTGRLPAEVQLVYQEKDGQTKTMPMSKSLDDPLFAGRVPQVNKDLTYQVRYGDAETRWFKVGVFDYPELQRADAKLKVPEYTGQAEKVVEDTRSVTAVEGTKATLTFRLNKPVTEARLVPNKKSGEKGDPAESQPVELKADPKDPSVYSANLDLKKTEGYRLQLVDADKRANKDPAEIAINVTPNRPPDVKLEWPGRDVDVSPIEEMTVRAKVWDDFGVKRVGMTYTMAGQPPQEVTLAEGVAGNERKDVAHLVALEKLAAQPDQLLSYYVWVEDLGPDGKVRRNSGDMFFAEVRPFEEIYRQGEQPSAEQQQQQQQQQGGQNAQQAEQLAELQKQIIAATWKLIRRETRDTPTPAFVPDVKLIGESQAEAKEKAEALGERLSDERSKTHLESALKHMDQAIAQLGQAEKGNAVGPLPSAMSAEQAAYQALLKLRAREHEVVRGNQRQQGGQSSSSASARRQ